MNLLLHWAQQPEGCIYCLQVPVVCSHYRLGQSRALLILVLTITPPPTHTCPLPPPPPPLPQKNIVIPQLLLSSPTPATRPWSEPLPRLVMPASNHDIGLDVRFIMLELSDQKTTLA